MVCISLIAAMDKNRVIGQDQKMPWHLPADLKHFKAITLGKPVIMGRLTFESIGKPLPGRHNIVLTQNRHFVCDGVTVVHDIDTALETAKKQDPTEILIIGGATLYQAMLPLATRLYLTHIDTIANGDTYFPNWHAQGQWEIVSCKHHRMDTNNPYDYSFITYERVDLTQDGKPTC